METDSPITCPACGNKTFVAANGTILPHESSYLVPCFARGIPLHREAAAATAGTKSAGMKKVQDGFTPAKEYRVDLTYFEINGKRYSDASYTSYKTEMSEILTEVRLMASGLRKDMKLPGLVSGTWGGPILVDVPYHFNNVQTLVLPDAAKVEKIRKTFPKPEEPTRADGWYWVSINNQSQTPGQLVKGKWSVWSDSPYESILVIDDTETAAFNLRVGEPIADGR